MPNLVEVVFSFQSRSPLRDGETLSNYNIDLCVADMSRRENMTVAGGAFRILAVIAATQCLVEEALKTNNI